MSSTVLIVGLLRVGVVDMISIETKQDPFEGHDKFKLTGTIKYGDSEQRVLASISTTGSRKSEAVERAIQAIDSLVKYLNESKEKLGAI